MVSESCALSKMGVKFDQDWTTTFVTISDVSFHRPVHMSDSARQRPATALIGTSAWRASEVRRGGDVYSTVGGCVHGA